MNPHKEVFLRYIGPHQRPLGGEIPHGFAEMCETTLGYNPSQANKHFLALTNLPDGWECYGTCPESIAEELIRQGRKIIILGPEFDPAGETIEGRVKVGTPIPTITKRLP